MHIYTVLSGERSDIFKSVKGKVSFSLNLPTTDFSEKGNNILSKFILLAAI